MNQSNFTKPYEKTKIDYSKIYSPSKLDMFSKCPKSYHFYYLDPILSKTKNDLKKQPPNIWSFHTLGKAIHNAITLFYYLPPELRTKDQLKENLKLTWKSEVLWNKKMPLGEWGGFKTIEEERENYSQALQMLENFFQLADTEPEIGYLPVKDFTRSIDDYHNLITPISELFDISGKFDLIIKDNEGFLHIIDFKTGKKEEDNNFQLRFYKLLAESKFKKKIAKASFYFLKTGNTKRFDLEEGVEGIKDEILGKINQIGATKNFEARPSKLCKFCLFKTFCPEKDKVREIIQEAKEEEYSDDLPF